MVGREVAGVCMHGGELRTNTSPRTREAIEQAGYLYETMYRNRYYLPLHLPAEEGVRGTLSIGQHFADITVPGDERFSEALTRAFPHVSTPARANPHQHASPHIPKRMARRHLGAMPAGCDAS